MLDDKKLYNYYSRDFENIKLMELIRGYIHAVREDVNYNHMSNVNSVSMEYDIAGYVMAISNENKIDSVGIRCKINIEDNYSKEELIGFVIESGIIFSDVGSPKKDLGILEDIMEEAFKRAINYMIDRTPLWLFKKEFIKQPNYKECSKDILIRLIEYGMYS